MVRLSEMRDQWCKYDGGHIMICLMFAMHVIIRAM